MQFDSAGIVLIMQKLQSLVSLAIVLLVGLLALWLGKTALDIRHESISGRVGNVAEIRTSEPAEHLDFIAEHLPPAARLISYRCVPHSGFLFADFTIAESALREWIVKCLDGTVTDAPTVEVFYGVNDQSHSITLRDGFVFRGMSARGKDWEYKIIYDRDTDRAILNVFPSDY